MLNEKVANMDPSWHENPAQINAYVDNLEDQNKLEKAMNDKPNLTTVRRAERPGAGGRLCDPRTFQEICLGNRNEQEAIRKMNGASRSISNQVYEMIVFHCFSTFF